MNPAQQLFKTVRATLKTRQISSRKKGGLCGEGPKKPEGGWGAKKINGKPLLESGYTSFYSTAKEIASKKVDGIRRVA